MVDSLLSEVRAALTFSQPGLEITQQSDHIRAVGPFALTPREPNALDHGPLRTYVVDLRFPLNYPEDAPVVRELSGAFEHNERFHCSADGTCCICVWEHWLATCEDNSVHEYVNGPVHNYFLREPLNWR